MINPSNIVRVKLPEWYEETKYHLQQAEQKCKLAERIRAECARVEENVNEVLQKNLNETNSKLKDRIQEELYRKEEIDLVSANIQIEMEPLSEIHRRISFALKTIESCSYQISKRCCDLREHRLGIDLVKDAVEKELHMEIKVIEGAIKLLQDSLKKVIEMERQLRASLFYLNVDWQNKFSVLSIDQGAFNLKETDVGLSVYEGKEKLDQATISVEEWERYTDENIASATKRIESSRTLRTYVDTVLRQIEQDLRNQDRLVNDAFKLRIEEVQQAKANLETQHFDVVRQANEISRTVANVEKAIADKEKYTALAHTRLGQRAQRPGVELVRDDVNGCLVKETVDIRGVVAQLELSLAQAQAVKRELLKSQVQLEEEINIKMNSLKIDEVDCMTLRQSIQHPSL